MEEIINLLISNNNNNLKELLLKHKDISRFIKNTQKTMNEIGCKLIKDALELADEIIKDSNERKRKWHVERKLDTKKYLTEMGEVKYSRTYYKHKRTGEYCYLSDEILGIKPHEKIDNGLKIALIDKASDLSYEKSAKDFTNGSISKQTVMNSIKSLGKIEADEANIKFENKKIKTLFIEADEDHVPLQNGKNKQVKLIYVHEGREQVSKNKYHLKNKRYFTGNYSSSEELWLKVADYIDEAYDAEYIEKIYLSGDGASWIKEGLNWINKSIYVLDFFHLSKYIKKATSHIPYLEPSMWSYINEKDRKSVNKLFEIALEETINESTKETIIISKKYINNNWVGIINRQNKDYEGCSAEGHISHVLSSRLSSRPMAWSEEGADRLARIRVHKENGGEIETAYKNRKKEDLKTKRIELIDKKVMQKRLKKKNTEKLNNIEVMNLGKKTWARELLRLVRDTY